MNDRSALYKALSERGQEVKLSPDFQLRMMCQIREIEARKKHRERVWTIVGYATAIITAVVTLIVFCGKMFARFFEKCTVNVIADYHSVDFTEVGNNMVQEFSSIHLLNLTLPVTVTICALLLLSLDRIIRKKLAVIKDNINIE